MKLQQSIISIQKEVQKVIKDGKNPHHKSSYPTLESVLDTINDHLHKHDIGLVQYCDKLKTDDGVFVWVLASELWKDDEKLVYFMPLFGIQDSKNPMQALGSCITYSRRYFLMSFFKLAPTDDDAEALAKKKVQKMNFDATKMLDNFAKYDVRKEDIENTYGELRKLSDSAKEELRAIYQALVDGAKPSQFFN